MRKLTRPTVSLLLVAAVSIAFVLTVVLAIERQAVAASAVDVPAAARQALQRLAGDAKLDDIEHSVEHGVDVYEASWTVDGAEHEAEVTADGGIVEIEQSVKAEDVPEIVRRMATKHLPKGAEISYERKMIVVYSAEARVNGKEVEVELTALGQKYDDDEDDGEDDDD